MKCTIRSSSWLLVGMMFICAAGHIAWASPSGLNNIPTTDVVPPKVAVVQTWLNMANNAQTQQFVGFKTGVLKGLEVGFDWKANDETHGHAELQAKYAFDIMGDWWKGVGGLANLHQHLTRDVVLTSYKIAWVRFSNGNGDHEK